MSEKRSCKILIRLLIKVTVFLVVILNAGSCRIFHFSIPLEVSANTILVRKGGDFQEALDQAKPGDVILLQAGETFQGAFRLPNKPGSEFITIRSSADPEQLPPPNVRIDPKKFGPLLPKLESNVKGQPAILATNGAHHFRFIGIEFGPNIDGRDSIIQLGTGDETRVEDLPQHIEFDRVYIHGSPIDGQRRGIAANGKFVKIANSYISDIKREGDESQAIAAWATDGPIDIENNYLEAAGENVLFGGAGSALKLVPTDCSVVDNHLSKPLEWRDAKWVVKNLLEIKNGRRIKIENNLLTNNWGMAQDGMAVLFTTRADNGNATIIEDIDFIGNIVRGSGGGINIYGSEGGGGHRLRIQNNVFDDINGQHWNGAGHFMKSTDWDGLSIENNTIIQSGNITNAYGAPIRNFVFRNNIVFENDYGIFGDNTGSGQVAIDKFFPNGTVVDNIIVGETSSLYRGENFFLTSLNLVGFIDTKFGDYRLRPTSPYKKKGLAGSQIGANLNPLTVGTRSSERSVNLMQ